MKRLFLVLFLSGIIFSGVPAQVKSDHRKISKATSSKKHIIKYGTASFYAGKFNGRQTSNGDTYNSTKYTAACNVLPLNTRVKVTNLKNKRSVVVMINDRLHVKSKCIIDLSKDAAYQLGYTGKGLAHVKVEVLPGQ